MFKLETQENHDFDALTSIQIGWEFTVSQLGPSKEATQVNLYQTPHVAYHHFRCSPAYDQRVHSREGFLSFGLLDPENPPTWAYDQLIPNDAIIVFPHDRDIKGASPEGFRGNGMHFAKEFMTSLAENVYSLPLNALIPSGGIYMTDVQKLGLLRAELRKWQESARCSVALSPALIARREESLALAVVNALIDEKYVGKESLIRSTRSVSRALDLIHSSDI